LKAKSPRKAASGSDRRPTLCSGIVSGKERILTIESDWPDSCLNAVVVIGHRLGQGLHAVRAREGEKAPSANAVPQGAIDALSKSFFRH
jgi:hypothetical protein